MKTLVAGTSNHSPDAAKATLRAEFEHFLETLSLPLLVELAEQEVEKRYFDALKMVLKREGQKALSPKVRNQLAYAKGKALAFKSVNEAYELLDSKTVCSLLGITRQALNKRVQTGQVLAYSEGARKHYPAFQFENNTVMPEVGELVKALAIDPRDEKAVNVLVGFLAQPMDYSNPGEAGNVQPRYALLAEATAYDVIVRDFRNRLAMGK